MNGVHEIFRPQNVNELLRDKTEMTIQVHVLHVNLICPIHVHRLPLGTHVVQNKRACHTNVLNRFKS